MRQKLDRHYFEFSLSTSNKRIQDHLTDLPFDWDVRLGANSNVFMLSNQPLFGIAGSFEAVLIDLIHLSYLDVENIEFITNRFSTPIAECLIAETRFGVGKINKTTNQTLLAEDVMASRVPNYLFQDGPYHPCVEEAREDPFLSYFREWIAARPKRLTEQERSDIANEANAKFSDLRNTIFLKHLSPRSAFESLSKTGIYAVIDLLQTGIGTLAGLTEGLLSERRRNNLRWQGFLASEEQRKRQLIG